MTTANRIGNTWYTEDAEYSIKTCTVSRGDGDYIVLDTEGEAEDAAEQLATGHAQDSDYAWSEPINP